MEQHTTTTPIVRLIRTREACLRTGLAKSSIYDLMSQNRFPQTVRLGGRSVAFVEAEIDEWIAERITARDTVA